MVEDYVYAARTGAQTAHFDKLLAWLRGRSRARLARPRARFDPHDKVHLSG